MRISFDPAKRASNLAKHGLDLAYAGEVLAGLCVERIDDRFDYGELRLWRGAVDFGWDAARRGRAVRLDEVR